MDYKAIDTNFDGCRFRSRLEARWAMFFNRLRIKYDYEPQGFLVNVGDKQVPYLPDFFLPDLQMWVEVKGFAGSLTTSYVDLLASAVDYGGALPGISNSCDSTRGLLILGPIPRFELIADKYTPAHCILQHRKGGWMHHLRFIEGGQVEIETTSEVYFDALGSTDELHANLVAQVFNPLCWNTPAHPQVRNAYLAASKARFERGESGAA